jgi:FkbM family methyltransferase
MQRVGLGREWSWPVEDDKCHKVIFEWADDVERVCRHVTNFGTCVQAGGNMGVWPWLLAKKFSRVHTFEPDARCLPHLTKNLEGVENVCLWPYGLWSEQGKGASVAFDGRDSENLGAQYLKFDGGDVEVMTIDSLGLKDCGLIYLDIEGAEFNALIGALTTIRVCKPVIAVEDKGLSTRYGGEVDDVSSMMKALNYKHVARYRRDSVFVHVG